MPSSPLVSTAALPSGLNATASTVPGCRKRSPSGVRVATTDANRDGVDDLIVAPGLGQRPEVKVLNGKTLAAIYDFITDDPTFLGGIFVAGR